ncbi:hypothetical protein ACFQX6_43680 [Streptosporangium lutulentum]
MPDRLRHDLVTRGDLGDHHHVGLQAEESDEGTPNEVHVLRQQHPDHVATPVQAN